jgi:Bacterial TSP3 repeat
LGSKYSLLATPGLPTNLIIRAISPGQVSLFWDYPLTNDSTEFVVERNTAGGIFAEITVGPGRSLIDTAVVPGETYTYRVRARNYSGTSTPSNEATVLVPLAGADMPMTGIRLWLKADCATNPVADWLDQSGGGNNAVQTSGGSQPTLVANALNGRPVVHFNGNQYLALPNLMNGASAGEIFIVVKSATDGADRRMMRFGTSGYASAYPWSDGKVYEDFGSTVNYGLGNPPQALNQYHIYNVSSRTNEWVARFDGVEEHRETNNTVGFRPDPFIGHGNNENFAGDMAEIIIYDHVLTPAERKATETYLGSKYALVATPAVPTNLVGAAVSSSQVSLLWNYPVTNDSTEFVVERKTTGGSFAQVLVASGRSLIDSTVVAGGTYTYRIRARNYSGASDSSNEATVLVPFAGAGMPTDGIRLWLKADCATNPVADWLDQSGGNNNAVQSSGGSQPTLVVNALNGRPVVHFNGNQYLALPNLMSGANAGEIFMVVKSAVDGAERRMMRFGTSGYASAYPWSDGKVYEDFGSTVNYGLGNPPQALNQYHIYNVSSKTNEWVARFDGLEEHRETDNTVGFRSDPFIGHGNNENFAGDMAEIIIYDHVLPPGERDRVQYYLAAKYLLAAFDLDGDGLTNAREMALGTDPYKQDSNGDGMSDGAEYWTGLSPTSDDVDGDGLTNAQEITMGTNPFLADTDRDGVPDAQDAYPLDPTRWRAPTADPNDQTAPIITLTEPAAAVLLP